MGNVRVSVADLMLSIKYVILQQSHESSAGWLSLHIKVQWCRCRAPLQWQKIFVLPKNFRPQMQNLGLKKTSFRET